MFSLCFILVFLIAEAVCFLQSISPHLKSSDREGWVALAFCFGAMALIFSIPGFIFPASKTPSDIAEYHRLERDHDILVEQAETVRPLIEETIGEYPALEREVLDGIDPEILLQYPELKANAALQTQLASLVQIEDGLTKNELRRSAVIETLEARDASPWHFYTPGWKNQLGLGGQN